MVANWIAFTPEHVAADIEIFAGRVAAVRLHQHRDRLPQAVAVLPARRGRPARQPDVAVRERQDPLRGAAARLGVADDDRASLVHLRGEVHPDRARRRRLDDRRPAAAWKAGGRARRRRVAVDDDALARLRARLRRPARERGCGRRELPHHLRRGADVEPDHRDDRARRGRRAEHPRHPVALHRVVRCRSRDGAAVRQGVLARLRQLEDQALRAGLRGGDLVRRWRRGIGRVVRGESGAEARRPERDALLDRIVAAYDAAF